MNPLSKTIQELEAQKAQIETAIRTLQSLNGASDGRRAKGTRRMSAEGRRRIAEAQRKRWAKFKSSKKS